MGFWSDFTDYFVDNAVPIAASVAAPAVVGSFDATAPLVQSSLGNALVTGAGRFAGEAAAAGISGRDFDPTDALINAGITAGTTYILSPSKKFRTDDDGNFFDDRKTLGGVFEDLESDLTSFDQTVNEFSPIELNTAGYVSNIPFADAAGAFAPTFARALFPSGPSSPGVTAPSAQQFDAAQGTTSSVALPSTGQVTPTLNVVEASNITTDVPSLPSGVTLGDQQTGSFSTLVKDRNTGNMRRVNTGGTNFASRLARRQAGGF